MVNNTSETSVSKKNLYLKISLGIFSSFVLCSLAYFFIIRDFQFKGRSEYSVSQMYDKDDLSTCSLFTGNFINFGFWKDSIKNSHITIEQRLESEKNLYRYVLKSLNVSHTDKLLEVACGQGVGSALAFNELKPKEIHGIDFSKAQISRAKKINLNLIRNNPNRISFQHGAAEKIPFSSNEFDKIFSIEAAQHFEDLAKFSKESNRVLKKGGKIAIATFFGTKDISNKALSETIQTINIGIDKATPIHEIKKILEKNGFININVKSIGKNVWEGFDKWTSQGDLKDSWTRNWYKGYKNNLIDYYIVTAEKK